MKVERALKSLRVSSAILTVSGMGCGRVDSVGPRDAASDHRPVPVLDADALPPAGTFCALPGSFVSTDRGPMLVPGATSPDLGWLKVPVGFCAHYFATVRMARQLRVALHGEVYVASPRSSTTGGSNDGVAGVVVLPDDDGDGVADGSLEFLSGLPSVQGLMLTPDHFYYQDAATIRRIAYHDGDRQPPTGPSEIVTQMAGWPQDGLHWPKVFDTAQDGTIYITNGSNQTEQCLSRRPVFGAVVKLNPDGTTSAVARGFRNPIALGCERDHDVCMVVELALDYSEAQGGREKIIPVRQGDDWGYPCCATRNVPYTGVSYADTGQPPDCSGVAAEGVSFVIGHTPFGLDFETGRWPTDWNGQPSPWRGRLFVTLHGDYGSWAGARVVAIALDPTTGLPLPASELSQAGAPRDDMLDFATGWDDGAMDHGRPAPIAFAPDGRLFIGDDQRGAIVWVAPVGLMRP